MAMPSGGTYVERERVRIPKVGLNCNQPKDGNGEHCTAPWQWIIQYDDKNETRGVCCGKHLTTAIENLMDNHGNDSWNYVRVRAKLVDFS